MYLPKIDLNYICKKLHNIKQHSALLWKYLKAEAHLLKLRPVKECELFLLYTWYDIDNI